MTSPASPDLRLGYLVFEARRPKRWAEFCEHTLGLPAPLLNPDGSRGWQLDAQAQRLVVQEGPADDVAAIGLQCAKEQVLDALRFKCDLLWAQLDALHFAYVEPGLPPPGAWRP